MLTRKHILSLAILVILALSCGSAFAAERVTLEFWTFVSDHQDFYELMAEEFNKAQDEYEIILKGTTIPVDQMHDNLLISLIAGVGAPDIVDVNIQYSGMFFKQNPEYFVDLTDVVDSYKDVLNMARLTVYTDPNGRVMGLPTHLGTGVMYYNKPAFEAAGIDIDDIKFYDDWVEVGKKVTKPDKNIWMTAVENKLARQFLLWTMQKGGYMIDPDGNLTVNGPKAVEALQFIYDLVHVHKIATIAPGGLVGDPSFYDMMNRESVLSLPYAQWFTSRFKNFMPDIAGKVAIRPLPLWEPGGFTSATMGGTGTAVIASSPRKDAAVKFLEYAKLSYEGNVRIWTDLGFDPPRMDVYDDPRLMKPDPYFANEPALQAIKVGAERLVAKPVWPLSTEVMMKLNRDTLYNVLEGNQTPQEALDEVVKELGGK
jgi:arabinosaccharide transport system substrate-binding protein